MSARMGEVPDQSIEHGNLPMLRSRSGSSFSPAPAPAVLNFLMRW